MSQTQKNDLQRIEDLEKELLRIKLSLMARIEWIEEIVGITDEYIHEAIKPIKK